MTHLQKSVQTGIELAQKAIALDTNHQYQEAVQEYNAAIDVFSEIIQDPECSEQKRAIVTQKIQEYQSRVVLLLDALKEVAAEAQEAAGADEQPAQTQQQFEQAPQQFQHPQSQQFQHPQSQQFQPQQSQQFEQAPPIQHQSPLVPQHQSTVAPSQPQQSPASAQPPPGTPFLVTPTGPVPLTPELAVQLVLDPLHVEYAQRYPKDVPNLQAALTLAEKAKEADVRHNYQQALDLYADVLERFTLAASSEKNPAVQTTLLSTINAYKDRAEKIKAAFGLQARNIFVPVPAVSREATANLLPGVPSNIRRVSGEIVPTGGQGNPLTVNKTMKRIGLRAGTLALEATIKRNVISRGEQAVIGVFVDNRSGSPVSHLKVKLVRVIGNKARKDWKKQILSRQEYFQGSIFPLQAENSYRGDLVFPVPKDGLFVPNAACSFYFVIECDLSLSKNLKAKMPIIISQ